MKPILIIQLQRMGDMILTYPLFLWLQKAYPNHPICFFGEEHICKQVKDFFPGAIFFSWTTLAKVLHADFFFSLNLSHRKEAARLNYLVRAEQKYGYVENRDGHLYIKGKWQLYRASLVQNNTFNAFHWADLNALDVISLDTIKNHKWSFLTNSLSFPLKLGLFLGASEESKCPNSFFWEELITFFLNNNKKPFLLGGLKEKKIANSLVEKFSLPKSMDFTGKFNLVAFAKSISFFDLFITPDTGPMHIAVFMGKQVLNISMGNVSPWDTGPYLPGNMVIRRYTDCFPCWECNFNYECKNNFSARLVCKLLENEFDFEDKEYRLYFVSRKNGLFYLKSKFMYKNDMVREFWFLVFGTLLGLWNEEYQINKILRRISIYDEDIINLLLAQARYCLNEIKVIFKNKEINTSFWKKFDIYFRPLSSYFILEWQNNNFSMSCLKRSIYFLEMFIAWLKSV